MLVCKLCDKAYIGQTQDARKWWSNHKSQIRWASRTCNIATHCSNIHPVEMVGENKLMETSEINKLQQFYILERAEDANPVTLSRIEEKWRKNLW